MLNLEKRRITRELIFKEVSAHLFAIGDSVEVNSLGMKTTVMKGKIAGPPNFGGDRYGQKITWWPVEFDNYVMLVESRYIRIRKM